jgi:cytochrome c
MFARRFLVPAIAVAAGLSAIGASPAVAAGDPVHGVQVFRGTCGVCHLALKDAARADAATKIGPNLYGVVGRPSGTLKGFRYSAAMRSAGIVWTYDKLRQYAHAPQTFIPNVRMSFPGLPKQQDADDVAAYLATLK